MDKCNETCGFLLEENRGIECRLPVPVAKRWAIASIICRPEWEDISFDVYAEGRKPVHKGGPWLTEVRGKLKRTRYGQLGLVSHAEGSCISRHFEISAARMGTLHLNRAFPINSR